MAYEAALEEVRLLGLALEAPEWALSVALQGAVESAHMEHPDFPRGGEDLRDAWRS